MTENLTYSRRLPTLVASASYLTFACCANSWGPLLPILHQTLPFSLETLGLLIGSWSLGYLPGALLGGMGQDRYGARSMLLFALALLLVGLASLLGCLWFAFVPLPGLLFVMSVAGVGGGIIDATATALISTLYAHQRAQAFNLFTLNYPLSSALVSFVHGGLFFLFGNDPRWSLLVLVGMIGISGGLLVLTPNHIFKAASSEHPPSTAHRVPWTLWLPQIALLGLAMLLTVGLTTTLRTWTPTYLHLLYRETPATVALLSGGINGIVIAFRLLASLLAQRMRAGTLLVGSMGIALIGLAAMLIEGNLWVGMTALTITAIGCTPIVATFLAVGNNTVQQAHGSLTGFLLFLTGISNSIGTWLFGVILDQSGAFWAIVLCMLLLTGGMMVTILFLLSPFSCSSLRWWQRSK